MQDTQNRILQLSDLVTTRRCALRLDSQDDGLPLGTLLDKYLKDPPLGELLHDRRITESSADTLASVQDLVYVSDDQGRLRDIFAGVAFMQDSRTLSLDTVPASQPVELDDKDALLIDLAIDRTSVGYDRNWTGFNVRRWQLRSDEYSGFVRSTVEEACGHDRAEAVLELRSVEDKLKLVEVLARRIWESDFENYSRFIGRRLVYKTGDETVRSIIEGSGGGICSEKVQALKFLTDHYGLTSEFLLAGPNVPDPVPEARLREMLTTFDFRFSKRHMRYWQHIALRYSIDGHTVLVDDTNGNIPFLFLVDSEGDHLLGYESKPPTRVRMAVNEEDFYYHRVGQDIPQHLFFAMEGWIPYVDLVQVFDNELGLYISGDFMVAPLVFKKDQTFDRIRRAYLAASGAVGLECSVDDQWGLDAPLAQRFADREPAVAEKVLATKDHLLARYDECNGRGHHAGLVVIALGK